MSKNISKGLKLELLHSQILHSEGTPLLISPDFLRKRGCGQIDIAIIKDGVIKIYEIKSSLRISNTQKWRLHKSARLLSSIFNLPVELYLRVGLPKG